MANLSTEDRLEIEQLYAKYNHSIDFGDGDAWAKTFTPDGLFDGGRGAPMVGTEALAGFANGFASQIKGRHWTNNLLVEPSASGAAGKCYLILFNLAAEGGPAPMVTGVYHDELAKGSDGWRFTSRKVVGDG